MLIKCYQLLFTVILKFGLEISMCLYKKTNKQTNQNKTKNKHTTNKTKNKQKQKPKQNKTKNKQTNKNKTKQNKTNKQTKVLRFKRITWNSFTCSCRIFVDNKVVSRLKVITVNVRNRDFTCNSMFTPNTFSRNYSRIRSYHYEIKHPIYVLVLYIVFKCANTEPIYISTEYEDGLTSSWKYH